VIGDINGLGELNSNSDEQLSFEEETEISGGGASVYDTKIKSPIL
jgi:hypothetical protein